MFSLLLLVPLAAPPETRLEALERKERESGGYSYFTFAREALARRRGLAPAGGEREPAVPGEEPPRDERPVSSADPFGLLSGAAAIDESLALKRAERSSGLGPRDVPLDSVPGVTISEHPWRTMMAGRWIYKEPLADLVPHDHWYFTFTSPAKLGEMSDLLDAWGGSALRLVQVQDRDHRLRERYEAQLGVTVEAARKVPPRLVRAVALTGSDLYWVDGTDVTAIIDTPNPAALLRALGRPRHEIIAGRVVLSNSPAALERVRQTAAGRRPPLAKSLDFRYMRTVFERDAKAEDGFIYLSDPFIRALVGPATRVKAMRRAEGRAALTLASHAALLHAAEAGRLPANAAALLRTGRLAAGALEVPDGKPVGWDAKRREAASEAYGTLRAGTPLVDLPIERVTAAERAAYERFRGEYDALWGRFFDPVGVRFKLTPGEVKAEAYILPLVRSEAYDGLRRWATDATAFDPARLSDRTGAQVRLTPWGWRGAGRIRGLSIQLDDGEALAAWLGSLGGEPAAVPPVVVAYQGGGDELQALLSGGGVTFGFTFDDAVYAVFGTKKTARDFAGVEITRLAIPPGVYRRVRAAVHERSGFLSGFGVSGGKVLGKDGPTALYSAMIGGAFHAAFDEKALERRITAWKAGATAKGTPAAAGLMLSRQSPRLAAFLERLLEERTRAKSHAAATLWQALYDAGVVTPAMTDAQRDAVALRLLGFVPAVPDGSRFVYDARTRRVGNERHGSWAKPAAHDAPDADSPLGKLVRSIQQVSADLRFREDGIHTTVTFSRK